MLIEPLYHGYTALDFVIVSLAAILMPAMSILTGRKLALGAPNARQLIPRYIRTILRGWFFGAVVVVSWWAQARPFAALGLASHLSKWDYAGFALALLYALVMVVQGIRLASASAEKIEHAVKIVHDLKITPNTTGELALFMLMSVSGAVWEELVYRGFLIWFFVPLTGYAAVVVISALIFGLGHIYQGVRGFLQTTAVGVIFAALYLLTSSLWWLMAVHAVMDIAGGITTFQIKRLAARHALAKS